MTRIAFASLLLSLLPALSSAADLVGGVSYEPSEQQQDFKHLLEFAGIKYVVNTIDGKEFVYWAASDQSKVQRIKHLHFDGSNRSKAVVAKALGNTERYLGFLAAAANDGDSVAQQNLATEYLRGVVTERNYGEALRWYEAAVSSGRPEAAGGLALMYEQGLGVEANPEKARHFLVQAAEAGDVSSMCNAARHLEHGSLGFPLDPGLSEQWKARAKVAGFDCSIFAR